VLPTTAKVEFENKYCVPRLLEVVKSHAEHANKLKKSGDV
jgi:hypothetical protein